jgi:hypothetical protein
MQLLYDFKENLRYWNLKEEAVYCTLWRIHSGRDYGPVTRQTNELSIQGVTSTNCMEVISS